MKKWLLLLGLLLGPTWMPALAQADTSVGISVSKRVVITTQTAGVEILAADPYAKKTCLLNSTTNYLLIEDVTSTFSISATTGSFRLSGTVASTNPAWWCFDGPTAPYKGALYGVSGAAGDMTIDVIRTQ